MADLQELIKAIKQDKESNGDRDIKATLDLSELLGSNDNLDTTNYLLALKYIKVRRNILNALIKKTQGGKLRGLKLGKEIKISDLLGEPPKLGLLSSLKWLRVKNQILKKVGAAAKNANFEFGKEIDVNDILGSSPEQDFITKTRFFLIRQKLLSKIAKAANSFDGESMLGGILGIESKSDEIEGIDSSISSADSVEGVSSASAAGLSTDESLEELRGIHTGIDNIYDHLLDSKGDKLKDRENAREQIARNERRHDELLNAAKGGSGFLAGGMGGSGGSGGSGGDGGEKGFLRSFLEFKFADKLLRGKGKFLKGGLLKNAGSRALGLGRAALPAAGAALTKGGALLSAAATSTPGMMVGAGLGGYAVGTGINNIPKLFGSEDKFSDMMGRPLGNMLAKARGVDMSGPLSEEKILELHRQGLNANKPIYERKGIFRKKVITGYEKLERAGEAENSKGPSVSPTESMTGKKTGGEKNYKKALENKEKAVNDLKSFKDETVEGKDYEMIERPQGYRGVYMGTSFDEDGNVEKDLIRKYKDKDVQKKFIALEEAEMAAGSNVRKSEVDMLIKAGVLQKRYGGKDGSRRIGFRQNLELARRRYVKSKNIDIYAGTERGSQEYNRAQADDISQGGKDAIQKNILGEDNTFKPTESMTGKSTLSATGEEISEEDMTFGTWLRKEHNKSFIESQDKKADVQPTESMTGQDIKPDIKEAFGFIDGNPVAVIDGIPHMYGTTMTSSRKVKAYGQELEIKGEPAFYIKKGVNNLDDDPSKHIVHPTIYEDFKKSVEPLENGMGIPLSEEMIRNLGTASGIKQLDENMVSLGGNILGEGDKAITTPDLSADPRNFNILPESSVRVAPGAMFEERLRQSILSMDADETSQIQARSGNFNEESAARVADRQNNLTNTAQPIRRGVFGQTQSTGLNGFANRGISAIAGPDFQGRIKRVLSSRNPIGEGKKLFDRTKNRVEGFKELSPLKQGVRILNAPVPTDGSQLAATQSQNQDLLRELTSSVASSVNAPTVINNNQRSSNVTNAVTALPHIDKTRDMFSKINLGW